MFYNSRKFHDLLNTEFSLPLSLLRYHTLFVFIFSAVKEFVNLCQSANTQNVVLQYLEAGGGTQELLGLLKLDQKNNMTSAVPIFSALQCIIMK